MQAQLPVRVFTDHLSLSPDNGGRVWPPECRACRDRWPCHSFQRNLQAQCDNREDLMRAHMLIHYLRVMSRPELGFVGPEVHATLVGWIGKAVAAQRSVERARDAARTGAQRAVRGITGWFRNHWDSQHTDGNGRRAVRGDVRDMAGDRG